MPCIERLQGGGSAEFGGMVSARIVPAHHIVADLERGSLDRHALYYLTNPGQSGDEGAWLARAYRSDRLDRVGRLLIHSRLHVADHSSARFAHGSLFGISGILILERFGIKTFSSNNGIIALAPALFGQSANYMFGRICELTYFAVEPSAATADSRLG